ncbi:MAG: hypothetical protein EI684_14975 [Candidatus Viridilinea halotolerans]|uniref:Uncharacterized protein n=1 Tax=Candidatus Viridilinea halotolerans TaxID=2491704 RepID=A0A426TW66_9CHLR|nr:MAG: hypothetical protein EI684_14975 [Candidatus Viridilinea halotolerans]
MRAAFLPTLPHASPLDLADAPLREALSFLQVVGLVAVHGSPQHYQATPQLADAPFALLLLHHLANQCDPRQQALSRIQRTLVASDTLAVTPQALRATMERGPLRDLFAWTGEKVTFWSHLYAYLGLMRRIERTTELLVLPQPALVLTTLTWAQQCLDANPSLAAALRLIDQTLYACFTSHGQLQRGLAQTLSAMERLGQLRFSHHADAAQSLMLGERRVSEVVMAIAKSS